MTLDPGHEPENEPDAAAAANAAFEALADKIALRRQNLSRTGDDAVTWVSPSIQQSRFTGAEIYDADYPPMEYIVPGVIAPGVTLLVGAPKLGKSWLALDIAQAVAAGGEVLGGRQCLIGDVLYAALEDNPRRLQTRLRKVCGERPGERLHFWTEMPPLDHGGDAELRKWIAQAENPLVIILDVLTKVRPEPDRGESPYQYDYRCIAPLKAIADEFGVAVIVVHHTRKAEATDWLAMTSGTHGLTGAADATVCLVRGGQGVTLFGRGRDTDEFELALDFDKSRCRWRELGDVSAVRISEERRAILEVMADATEPLGPQEIAKATGHGQAATRVMLGEMVKAGQVTKTGRGKYLHPDSPLASLTSLHADD